MKKNNGNERTNEDRRKFVKKLKYTAPIFALLTLESRAERPGGSSVTGPNGWRIDKNPHSNS